MVLARRLSVALQVLIAMQWFAGAARGADYVLFDSFGQQVANYDSIIAKIQPGDRLFFHGRAFQITEILGHGMTTLVLGIGEGRALRIPLASGTFNGDFRYTDGINEFIIGQPRLASLGVGVVPMLESRRNQYVVVERLNVRFNLKDYLDGNISVTPQERDRLDNELIAWARTTARVRMIEDFHAGQLVYTNDGWKLIDFFSGVRRAQNPEDPGLFSSRGFWGELVHRLFSSLGEADLRMGDRVMVPRRLRARLTAAIQEERIRLGIMSPSDCFSAIPNR